MTPPETKEQREERMARAAAGRRSTEQRPTPGRLASRSRPVRTTVDLTPSLHRRLKHWAGDAADALDVPDVPTAEVIRALIHLLITDDALNDATLKALRERMKS
ncbi:hypothetical protein ACFPA8_27485 [Streptomyces ovatisporus]|uniref:Uncharacterized protein n=1 Tax=Streptomyces ovatisporus TaxID=1128682 RepID=A0ABV9ADD6_9ACTN